MKERTTTRNVAVTLVTCPRERSSTVTIVSLTRARLIHCMNPENRPTIEDEMDTAGCACMTEIHWAKEEEHVNSG